MPCDFSPLAIWKLCKEVILEPHDVQRVGSKIEEKRIRIKKASISEKG